jgi:hypothetical protein
MTGECYQSVLDPSHKPVPQLARIPDTPPEPTALQALLSPSHAWDDRMPTLPIRPCLALAPCGTTAPLGQEPSWCETAGSTILP